MDAVPWKSTPTEWTKSVLDGCDDNTVGSKVLAQMLVSVFDSASEPEPTSMDVNQHGISVRIGALKMDIRIYSSMNNPA